jgi:hypothetical protein
MTTKLTSKNFNNIPTNVVDWQSVITAAGGSNNATAGEGYLIDTTSNTHTIILPSNPVKGNTIIISDYAGTFETNNVTINPNGNNIERESGNLVLSNNNDVEILVFVDATLGWARTYEQDRITFISATGGTVTESGDYRIHTFTGDGCFVVSGLGNQCGTADQVDYLVIAGGGATSATCSGADGSGGGGAGGYRESSGTATGCYTVSPLGACVSAITVTTATYPITVGGGGATGPFVSYPSPSFNGSPSTFSTITSAGGGGSGAFGPTNGQPGGSGGGGRGTGATAGCGNTPPVNPPQGNSGGAGTDQDSGGGGGGATSAGVDGIISSSSPDGLAIGGAGGNGATSAITGTSVTRASGGTSSSQSVANSPPGSTPGGGGIGANPSPRSGTPGTANTGGGAGSSDSFEPGTSPTPLPGKTGGSGIVILRYKYK